MRAFIEEVKRRNVFKVAIVYLIAGWLTMQVVDVMFPALNLPEWLTRAVAAMLLLGFPFALIFAWAFELTPDGIKREKDVDRSQSITQETGQKLNRSALIVLTIAVGFLLLDKFVLHRHAPEPVEETAAVAEEMPSIAVLPFVNMSDDESNEYFSDGLSEELLNVLAKLPQLRVAGRTSSFKFKGHNEDLRIIGEALNVRHILEGSVRKQGDRLRITAQLIDTESGFHLWSDNFDRNLTDIFAIQDEIAVAVVSELKVALLGEDALPPTQRTTSVEAYSLLLQGNYYLDRTSPENIERARAAYEKAIELDPRFAEAYLGLAVVEQQTTSGWADSSGHGGNFIERFERVRELADKAMSLDSNNADAYIAKGIVASVADWDFVEARALFQRATELEPANSFAHSWLSVVSHFGRDLAAAERHGQKSIEIDPLSIGNLRVYGDIFATTGRYEKAMEIYQRAIDLAPDSGRLYGRIGRMLLTQGKYDEARRYVEREQVEWVRDMLSAILLRQSGDVEAWQAAVQAYIEKNGISNSIQYAEIYAEAGDLDQTFEWLEVVVEIKDPGAPWAFVSPWFEDARNDPRWAEFEGAFQF